MSFARIFDRHAAAEALGVTTRQFRQLIRNPKFPAPVSGQAPDEEWGADDIEALGLRLDRLAAQGWKTPDCLYPWDFDRPPNEEERTAAWEIQQRKLLAAKRAVEAQRQKRISNYRRQVWKRAYKNA